MVLFSDFSQRMKPLEALEHRWLLDALDTTINKANLKRYVIKKRWIKVVNTIIFLRRMGAKLEDK